MVHITIKLEAEADTFSQEERLKLIEKIKQDSSITDAKVVKNGILVTKKATKEEWAYVTGKTEKL